MTRNLRFAGIATVVLLSAACGGETSDTAADTTPSTTAASSTEMAESAAAPTSTTATAAPRAQVNTVADIQRIIAPLGLECSDEDAALFCNRDGASWQFRISPNGDGDAAFRRAACGADATYNSSGALTDGGKFVVYAGNDGQDLEGFKSELAAVGITILSIERGC